MFTGIIEEMGEITEIIDTGGDLRVSISASKVLSDVAIGDSIAVSGCCLTVIAFDDHHFDTELSKETVAKTAKRWQVGKTVNLERAMRLNDRLGGHIVSGHVESVGEVLDVKQAPGAYIIIVRAAPVLAKYLIPKGSISVDGVSLTVVDVGGPAGSKEDWDAEIFSLWIIPHTLDVTTLGQLQAGDQVNLEADVIAKYVERLSLLQESSLLKGHS